MVAEDWGEDWDDDTVDLEAVAALEAQALAERQAQTTGAAHASCSAPPPPPAQQQQQTGQLPAQPQQKQPLPAQFQPQQQFGYALAQQQQQQRKPGQPSAQQLQQSGWATVQQQQQQPPPSDQQPPPAQQQQQQQPLAAQQPPPVQPQPQQRPCLGDQQPPPALQQQQQQRGNGARGQPCTPTELVHRCRLFSAAPPPPAQPSHDCCPGVYGRGCGGALQLVRWAEGAFWACSGWPDCQFRDYLPPRKASPELALTVDRAARTVAAAPAYGAEDAVAFCGGVAAVLQVAGVELRRALPQLAVPATAAAPQPGAVAAPPTTATAVAPQTTVAAAALPEHSGSHQSETEEAAPAVAATAVQSCEGGCAAAGEAGEQAEEQQPQQQQEHYAPQQPPGPAAPPPSQPVVFPLPEYERLSNQLLQFGRQSGVCLLSGAGMVPAPTLKAARGALRMLPSPAQVGALYALMPAFLERALLPFQREGVRFGLARGGRCLIADEMGVGKTVQAIALASCYQDEWPLLIVVPASLRLVWAEELEKWLPHLRPTCIHVIEGKEDRVGAGALPLITITSYEMMQRLTCDACKGRGGQHISMVQGQRLPCRDLQNCMAAQRWRVVIVDESHALRTSNKPPDAAHTEAVVTAAKLARRAILLTGTPSLSRPFDLFRQVDAIMPGLLGRDRVIFASAYCNRRVVPLPAGQGNAERHSRWDVSGLSRSAELHDLLKAEVMLRRLKRDVMSQLPPKRRQVIRLPKPPPSEWPKLPAGSKRGAAAAADSGSEVEEDEEGEEGEGEAGDGSGGPPKHMSSAHRTGLAKASAVIDWLTTALGVRGGRRGGGAAQAAADDEGGEDGAAGAGSSDAPKVLVFAHHKTVMNRLAAALEGATGYAPVGYVRIDGGTDPEDRRAAVRRFASDAGVRVALLSVTAAGVGLDFSAASVVVFAELPDEVAHVRQAEDRAHRQGQRQPVNIYFLCAKGTTDDRRWQHLNRSLARVSAVHDGAGVEGGVATAAAGSGQEGGEGAGDVQEGGAAAVAAQAGLVVECVHDADDGGLTQAAKRGWPAGLGGEAPAAAAAAAAAADEEACSSQGSEAAVERALSGLVAAMEAAEAAAAPSTATAAAAAAAAAAEPSAGSGSQQGQPSAMEAAEAERRLPAAAELPPAEPVEVWFEVSGNTGRVHFHAAPDGSAPLLLSLPIDALLAGDSPLLDDLLAAVSIDDGQAQQQQQQQQQQHAAPAAGGADHAPQQQQQQQQQAGVEPLPQRSAPQRPAVVGGIGVLALDGGVSRVRLAAMLAEARQFAAEWRELRGLHRMRLQGRLLRVPLDKAAEEVDASAAAAGKLGLSTSRFVDEARSDLAVPPSAEWRPVTVAFRRYGRECRYQQPFLPSGARLCINCAAAVPGKAAGGPPETVLDGMTLLFCGGECEGRFALKSNGSAYRRALFKLERGVCISCRLDCHALVKRLQAVEKGSREWEEQRQRIIAAHAPRLMARGYKGYLDALVRRAVEGNAWQADHILPVYKGGGLCDVDNLRTLCVACHADVTREQAKERASTRQAEKATTKGGFGGGSGGATWGDVEAGLSDGEGGGGASKPAVKRRQRLQQSMPAGDDSDADDFRSSRSTAAALPPPPAGGVSKATQPRRRSKLKPLMGPDDGADADISLDGSSSGSTAELAAVSRKPARRQRTKLKPLMNESDDFELPFVLGAEQQGTAEAAAEAAAAAGQPAGQPASRLLSDENMSQPGGAPGGAAGSQQGAGKKRSRPAAAQMAQVAGMLGGSKATKASVRRSRMVGKACLEDGDASAQSMLT